MNNVKINNSYLISLISAVLVCFMCNMFIKQDINLEYLALELSDIKNMVIQNKQMIIGTVVFNRIKQFIIILIIMKAFGSNNTYNFFMVMLGGIIGLFLTVQIYYVGIQGLLIFFVYTMPHFIVYVFALYYSYKVNLFERGVEGKIKNLMITSIILFVGIIIECFFMTFFLKIFYQYMVS